MISFGGGFLFAVYLAVFFYGQNTKICGGVIVAAAVYVVYLYLLAIRKAVIAKGKCNKPMYFYILSIDFYNQIAVFLLIRLQDNSLVFA